MQTLNGYKLLCSTREGVPPILTCLLPPGQHAAAAGSQAHFQGVWSGGKHPEQKDACTRRQRTGQHADKQDDAGSLLAHRRVLRAGQHRHSSPLSPSAAGWFLAVNMLNEELST